jgi:hypothetical protein
MLLGHVCKFMRQHASNSSGAFGPT